MNWMQVEAHLPRGVAQEFKCSRCKPGDWNSGAAAMATNKWVSRSKEGFLRVQTLAARDHTFERKEKGRRGRKENGWHGHYSLLASSSPIHHRLLVRTTTSAYAVVIFKSCMLRMRTEGGVGSREWEQKQRVESRR